MNTISGACQLIKFLPTEEIAEELNNFAEEFFDVITINYTDDGKEELVGYKPADFKEKDMLEAAALFGISLPEYKIEFLESKNWLAENVIKFVPFEVGNFVVYGSHEEKAPVSKKIPVQVYAATAFGSEHQTTTMCLEAISFLAENNVQCKNILDVGTGSGILSIAAAKQWKKSTIYAVDIDEEAVCVCKNNSFSNGCENQILSLLGDGYQLEEIKKVAPFDLIMANIFARPLISMARDMSKNLKKSGFGIISGFIDSQLDWVLEEHKKFGLEAKKIYQKDNWNAVLLEKIK